MNKETYEEIAVEAVTKAIQDVAIANHLQLGEPAQIALALFGKRVTELVWLGIEAKKGK